MTMRFLFILVAHPSVDAVVLGKPSVPSDASFPFMRSPSLPGYPWLPVTLELELYDRRGRTSVDETKKSAQSALWTAAPDALRKSGSSNDMRKLTSRDHYGPPPPGFDKKWYWEVDSLDGDARVFELASPQLSEEEAIFASRMSDVLAKNFTGGPRSSFQVHVESRCLLKGGSKRLVGLLLTWERFHKSIKHLFGVQRLAVTGFAESISAKNPEFLKYLQDYWRHGYTEPLDRGYARYESTMLRSKNRKNQTLAWAGPRNPDRDGNRDYAVNVCHLLPVKCCFDCPKNDAPKLGGLEFRVFDTLFGQQQLYAITLVERLVQLFCREAFVERLEYLLLLPGTQPESDPKLLLATLFAPW